MKEFKTSEEKSAYFRDLQKLSRKNYSGSGGLRALSAERRKEISRMGVEKRRQIQREQDDKKTSGQES